VEPPLTLGTASVKAEAGAASPGATRSKLRERRRSLEAGSLKLEAASLKLQATSLKLEAASLKLETRSLKLGKGRPNGGPRRATCRSAKTYGVCPSRTTRQANRSGRLGQVLELRQVETAVDVCGHNPPPAAAFVWGAGETTAPTKTTTKLLVKCGRWVKRLSGKALQKCLHELTRFVKAGRWLSQA
jgi:hypothetical protein